MGNGITSILHHNAIEREIACEANSNRGKIESKWGYTKLPGFFESCGLSFKLSFPKTNVFQGLKDMAKSAASSFSKAVSAIGSIGSFSFKDALGKISVSFQTRESVIQRDTLLEKSRDTVCYETFGAFLTGVKK